MRIRRALILAVALCCRVAAQEEELPGDLPLFLAPTGPIVTSEELDQVWVRHLWQRTERAGRRSLIVETYCRQALNVDPENLRFNTRLAEYYMEKGEVAMSAMSLLYLKMLEPAHPMVRMQWEPLLEVVAGYRKGPARPEDLDASSREAEVMGLAADARSQQNWVRAENMYRLLLTKYPANEMYLNALGTIYILADDWHMATLCFRYALHLYPDNPEFANNYALALDRIGRTVAAIEVFEYHRTKHPRNAFLPANVGRLYVRQANWHAAADAYAAWSANDPNNADAWENYGICLLQLRKNVFAKVALRKAADLDLKRSSPHERLLELAILEGNAEEVLRWKNVLQERLGPQGWQELIQKPPFAQFATEVRE